MQLPCLNEKRDTTEGRSKGQSVSRSGPERKVCRVSSKRAEQRERDHVPHHLGPGHYPGPPAPLGPRSSTGIRCIVAALPECAASEGPDGQTQTAGKEENAPSDISLNEDQHAGTEEDESDSRPVDAPLVVGHAVYFAICVAGPAEALRKAG